MSTIAFAPARRLAMTTFSTIKCVALFAITFSISCSTFAQDKSFLKCDGKATVVASNDVNITSKEAKNIYKVKPFILRVVIDGERISVNSYEYKKIETKFPDKSTFSTFEHGNLEIKETYYDGYLTVERNKMFKDSTDNTLEKGLYFYQHTRIILDRLDGEFSWWLTYYGNNWINDLLPSKVKDKYLNLEVKGFCRRDVQKVLF